MLDRKIWAAASIMIDEHGIRAAKRTAEKAGHLLHVGDVEGYMLYRRILQCVEALQSKEPRPTEFVH